MVATWWIVAFCAVYTSALFVFYRDQNTHGDVTLTSLTNSSGY